jgi:hypothetical protein
MTDIYSQKRQWILLDSWFSETNPRKVFERFLLIHSFPASHNEDGGIYYNQICRKLLYANKAENPKEWVRKRLNENTLLNDADIVVDRFIHEAENPTIIKNLINTNILWLDASTFLYRVTVMLLILLAYIIWFYQSKQQEPDWWQK